MSKLLDPKVLLAIKDLSLIAKTTVEGFMNGTNKSIIKGQGLEFSQYRSYQPGDDLRSLDWKMFARSDRYYIRESEIETNINIRFLIDASASMNHIDGDFSKMEYSRYLVASLAYLASLQGDAVGLAILKEDELFTMPTKQDHQHLSRLFFQLEQLNAAGKFTRPIQYKELFAGLHRKEMLIFISDLYQSEGEIFKLLEQLGTLKHEVIVFQILSRNEIELDFRGFSRFEDLENGKTIEMDQDKGRFLYQQAFTKYLHENRAKMLDLGISYQTVVTDEPLDQVLRNFLKQRSKIRN